MKTIANCNAVEFLVQTNKIRKSVANWLDLTNVLEIRKKAPTFTDDMTKEEQKELVRKQVRQNISDMLDSALEEHPAETAELLGLLCFIEPDDLKNHKMTEFLSAVIELIESEEVISFFISLARLEKRNIFTAAKV